MTKTLDFESPAEILRIQLVTDIIQSSQMSERLAFVRQFEKDIIGASEESVRM